MCPTTMSSPGQASSSQKDEGGSPGNMRQQQAVTTANQVDAWGLESTRVKSGSYWHRNCGGTALGEASLRAHSCGVDTCASALKTAAPPTPIGPFVLFSQMPEGRLWGKGGRQAVRKFDEGTPSAFGVGGRWGGRRPGWSPRVPVGPGDEIGGRPSCCPRAGFPGNYPCLTPVGTIKKPHVFAIWKVLGLLTWFRSYVAGGGLDI